MKQGNDQQTQKKTQQDKNGNFKQKKTLMFPQKDDPETRNRSEKEK